MSVDPDAWDGRCTHSESTLHQLSPFLGKMKSSMAGELIKTYSEKHDTILDPFSGSGTVPLETALKGRNTIGIDQNPYSIVLSKAKLNPPPSESAAIERAKTYLSQINPKPEPENDFPKWVAEFFHPKTLSGLSQLFPLLIEDDEYFLQACMLGILHHQRPGFLSYPASNLKPYLRDEKFPREEYPEKYEYRDIEPRLISKIERAYRRFPGFDSSTTQRIEHGDSPTILREKIASESVDAIITSPPYMNKLDYGRDNRLRLFFIGVDDYSKLDGSPRTKNEYHEFLDEFLTASLDVLKPDGRIIFVLGESRRSGSAVDTSEVLLDMVKKDKYGLQITHSIQDSVPVREINSMSSNEETIVALEKKND